MSNKIILKNLRNILEHSDQKVRVKTAVDIFDCGDGVDVVHNYIPQQGDSIKANCEIVNEADIDVNVDTSADDLTVGPKDDADGGIGNGDNDNSNVKTPATDLTTAPATNDTDPTENDADENPSKDNPVSDEKLTLSLKKNDNASSDDSIRLPN